MRIRWTPSAAADLEEIHNYLAERHPELAASTVKRLYEAVKSLRSMPHRGRPGRLAGTRELVLADLPYLVQYRIRQGAVEIYRIWHGARRPPAG